MNERKEGQEDPLTIREYLGAFLPPREAGEENASDRPLTTREYLGSIPNIYELVDLAKNSFRGALRFVQRNKGNQ